MRTLIRGLTSGHGLSKRRATAATRHAGEAGNDHKQVGAEKSLELDLR
jgi:hypothetical protein